jgi:IclR family transcriptional regulator, KDG regulon repressor
LKIAAVFTIIRFVSEDADKSIHETGPLTDRHKEPPDSFVARMAAILTCLSQGIDNVTDIAGSCNLSTSTVHRMLNTLKEPKFTVYDSIKHRYYLGPLIAQLASNPRSNHQYLVNCAVDEIKRLSVLTEETITLNVLMGLQMLNLYDIQSKHHLNVQQGEEGYVWQAPVLPAGAVARVLLSQLGDKELSYALKSITILNSNILNKIDVDSMMTQMQEVRRQGYSITCGEMAPEAMGIAVPLKNYNFPAALVILGPESRLKSKSTQLIRELSSSAQIISNNIRRISK